MGRRRKSTVELLSPDNLPDVCAWDTLSTLVRVAAGGCQEILVCCGGVCQRIATICPNKDGANVELITRNPMQDKTNG